MTTTSETTTPATTAGHDPSRPPQHADAARFGSPTGSRLIPTKRQIRVPWVLAGVLIVVGSGLTFATWADGANDRTEVLALSRSVTPGEVIERDDLAIAAVTSDTPLDVINADDLDRVIGSTVTSALSPGALLTSDSLTDGPPVDNGNALVAVTAPDTALPAADLQPGAPVMLVDAPADALIDVDDGASAGPPRVWVGLVHSVTTLEDLTGTVLSRLTVEVDPFSAAEIAVAAASDRVRVVVIATTDDVPPELLLGELGGSGALPDPAGSSTAPETGSPDETPEP